MGKWKNYTIYFYGEEAGHETARSKKEAIDLYVKKCKKIYIENFGDDPTDDMVEGAYKNIEAVGLSD